MEVKPKERDVYLNNYLHTLYYNKIILVYFYPIIQDIPLPTKHTNIIIAKINCKLFVVHIHGNSCFINVEV